MSSYERVLQVPIHLDGKQNKTPPKSKQREKKIHIEKIACESFPRTDKPWRPEELINLGHQECWISTRPAAHISSSLSDTTKRVVAAAWDREHSVQDYTNTWGILQTPTRSPWNIATICFSWVYSQGWPPKDCPSKQLWRVWITQQLYEYLSIINNCRVILLITPA